MDIHNRQPLQTLPAWPDNHSYQVPIPTATRADKIRQRKGRQIIVQENELKRIQSFFSVRGDAQAGLFLIQYTTEQYPVPIQISPGIVEDVDPSATLEDDVKVIRISKLIEGIVLDKRMWGHVA
jgi:hypothetical protein